MQHLISRFRITALGQHWLILLFGTLILVPTPAVAEYKLQSGDILELSISGSPNFTQRMPIELDGIVALPLIGPIKVNALSVSEARAIITRYLSNKVYLQPNNNGREVQHLILPNEIVVTVAEYRPIYVNGHVAKPGGYTFRPGITVRQAIALAGGYGSAVANPLQQAADVRSEYEALLVEFATEQDRIWRLRTELGQEEDYNIANNAPIPDTLRLRLKQTAAEYLKARMADRLKDKAFLQDAIDKANLQLGVLSDKKKKDEEGNQADTDELEQVRQLFHRGQTVSTRLSEARRAALLSSDQFLQTVIQISNVERQRGEYMRLLEKTDSQASVDDWKELQQANSRLAQITARLKGAGEKLIYMGLPQSQSAQGTTQRFDITVHRKDENGSNRITADEDLELTPGDVIEVAIQNESRANLSSRSENAP